MLLMKPPKSTCPICATKHEAQMPHNQQSIYYQYRFYGVRGRWPTWADAVAHCSDEMQAYWKEQLGEHWTEPDGEPIADPPHDSLRQTIGDINSRTFGPD
jgi:hypothetical protein